jgi:hypothetical protein
VVVDVKAELPLLKKVIELIALVLLHKLETNSIKPEPFASKPPKLLTVLNLFVSA